MSDVHATKAVQGIDWPCACVRRDKAGNLKSIRINRPSVKKCMACGCARPKFPIYRCAHCGKVVERDSDKAWVRSYCEDTGRTVHLQRATP